MHIVVILTGIFIVTYIASNLVVPENDAATLNYIRANEMQFRIGVISLLSLALYEVLKTVHKNLALLTLLWRLGEAIIGGGVTVLSGLIPLMLLHRGAAFETERLLALVGLFLTQRPSRQSFRPTALSYAVRQTE